MIYKIMWQNFMTLLSHYQDFMLMKLNNFQKEYWFGLPFT